VPLVTQSLVSDEDLLPESTVQFLLRPYEPYLQKNIPGASLDSSLEEIMNSQLQQQTPPGQQPMVPPEIAELLDSPSQKSSASANLSTMITANVNNQIRHVSRQYPVTVPLMLFAVIILASRVIVPVLSIVPLVITALLIWLSRKANLVKLISQSLPVEHLEL